jgi:EAL domain-containing protein (putative c-di-GMP-specific phosphodiesterase class I)
MTPNVISKPARFPRPIEPLGWERSMAVASILLVDDDATLRHIYARIFKGEGYSVVTVASGDEAAVAFEPGAYDVVVSDIDMPGLSGIELLRMIRERDPDVPVVLLSGGPTLETAMSAIEHGATRFLTKPCDPEQLKDVMRRALHVSRLARVRRQLVPFTEEEALKLTDRAHLMARFDAAMAKLFMVYQPIFRSSEQRVVAYEALARSEEPTMARPTTIFEVAERLDRVEEIGRGVRSICALPVGSPRSALLFVNLHTLDLADESLYDPSSPLCARAAQVVFEITERARLDSVDDVPGRIRRLRDLGFRIALDDLGAGYAGLTSFASLEPDFVKLDMSLVRQIDRSKTKQKLVGSMIKVCTELGVEVVAEGVETFAERDTLVGLGCDLLQGFLLGTPIFPPRRG